MAKKKSLRKCQYCDEVGERSIELNKDDFVFEIGKGKSSVKKFYHKDCYIEYLKQKKHLTAEEIDDKIKLVSKEVEVYKYETKIKNDFFDYVYDLYEVSNMPQYYYQRVDEVVCGVYKGMKEAISYEYLLEMYKRQTKYLNKIAEQKMLSGNGFRNNLSRAVFDLAVIVNKYDSFKKWKKKQEQLKNEVTERKCTKKEIEDKIAVDKLLKSIPKSKKDNKEKEELDLSEFF